MNAKRTTILVAMVLFVIGTMTAVAQGEDGRLPAAKHATSRPSDAPTQARTTSVLRDKKGDVANAKLDIQQVKVVNKPGKLKVRVYFPGVAQTYDFPLGAVSVYLDTDADRVGPEYGHFMDFFSDYRFAPADGWLEHPTPEWGHSPEGRCVETAGVQSDKQSKLRWFEYVVRKTEGCFDSEAVRVAVTSINVGDLQPTVNYDHPFYDHLGAKHAWSPWIPVA